MPTLLNEKYHDVAYSKSNKLDGEFKYMMWVYEKMYGRFMPDNKEAKILDVACGGGQFLKYLKNKGYKNHVGIDISEDQCDYVRYAVTHNAITGDAFGYLKNMNLDIYDMIVANDFIEHVPRDKGIEIVGLIHQALKPGGRIILKTGNMAAFGGLVILYNGLDHECGYTEHSLKVLLGIHGFKDIEIIPDTPHRFNIVVRTGHFILKWLYKHYYRGNMYPRCVSKVIAVTGVK